MKKFWKRRAVCRALAIITAIAATTLIAAPAFAAPADPSGGEQEKNFDPPEQEHAAFAYLYNFENDAVLYEKGDLNLPAYPASIVKIMSGVVAIEVLGEDRLKTTTITEEMLDKASGNNIDLQPGEQVTAEQMLYALLVNGANDAAYVLAYIASGSAENFVERMNDKARELGMNGTFYTNPTGMHDDSMYTTAADTVKLAKYAYEIPYFMEIVSTPKYVMESANPDNNRNIRNRNCMISKYYRSDYFYDKAIGMNAGFTRQSGYSGVFVARSDDGKLTYLCVIMNAEATAAENGDNSVLHSYAGAIELFDWAFENYGYREVLSSKQVLAELPVTLSATVDYVTLVPSNSLTVYLRKDIDDEKDIKTVINTEESISAPVTKGQVAGSVKVMYEGRELGRSELITTADVTRSDFLYTVEKIREFTTGGFFIASAVSAVALTIAYVLVKARVRTRKLRRGTPGGFRKR